MFATTCGSIDSRLGKTPMGAPRQPVSIPPGYKMVERILCSLPAWAMAPFKPVMPNLAAVGWAAAAAQTGRAGDVDDVGGLGTDEAVPQSARQVEDAGQIDADNIVPIGEVGFGEAAWRGDAGVVYKNMDLAECVPDLRGGRLYLRRIGDIARIRCCRAAVRPDRLGDFVQRTRPAGDQDDVGAYGSDLFGDGLTQAMARAGDDSNFVVKDSIHATPSPL